MGERIKELSELFQALPEREQNLILDFARSLAKSPGED